MKKIASLFVATAIIAGAASASARDEIRVVGSSTVYPLVTVAAEKFGKGKFKTPVVESTGTGGGVKLFCEGIGEKTPDIVNASRKIKDSELELCKKNGVTDIVEVKLGYDGIVVANSAKSQKYELTKQDIFNALAKKIDKDGKLVDNPNKTWKDVNSKLPANKIEVYGPPPTSGTRDSFVEMVLVDVCKKLPAFEKEFADEKAREKACGVIREDGAYIEAGENDNLIIQKLEANPNTLGIFGYDFLENNRSKVQASSINGVEPKFDTISEGKYPVSRPLYVYAKAQHVDKVPGIKEFLAELVSDKAIGDDGYLTQKGLIPLHKDEKAKVIKAAIGLEKIKF